MSSTDTRYEHRLTPELWGGVECTVNRVGEQVFDQVLASGHASRLDDLDRIASLGLRTVRYPVLWERVQPDIAAPLDWGWTDERLNRLREFGIRPIATLIHHGSGPRGTHLTDPKFPALFEAYARAVAERYPWLDAYTPVNEPLTTARFSGLYGHWYPHRTDEQSFLTALLHQCEASTRGMQAVRAVNPDAEWIQTEDLGKVFATPRMKYQAEFENERRWLSMDLLMGQCRPGDRMWSHAVACGIDVDYLKTFLEPACRPDVLGGNFYLTSERFLDEAISQYPVGCIGWNGKVSYADVPSVRVRAEGLFGPGRLLREMAERFGRPVALTEVHLGCTREEQVRWLIDVWQQACQVRTRGVNVRAVTVWALFGAYDWNTLVTQQTGHYEPGAFDVSGREPRLTAVGATVRRLASRSPAHAPYATQLGWWRRPIRLEFEPRSAPAEAAAGGSDTQVVRLETKRPLLIFGNGRVGQALGRLCNLRGLLHRIVPRHEVDVTDEDALDRVLDQYEPWGVINATGFGAIEDAEQDPDLCRAVNVEGARNLARLGALARIPLLMFSSDLIFDGRKIQPYVETDEPRPLNALGRAQAEAERRVFELMPHALVARTSGLFGPWDRANFAYHLLDNSSRWDEFLVPACRVSPTYLPDLCHRALDLLIDGEHGLWHLANDGVVTWKEFAALVWTAAELPARRIRERGAGDFAPPRPEMSALVCGRGLKMPSVADAVRRFVAERVAQPRTVTSNLTSRARMD